MFNRAAFNRMGFNQEFIVYIYSSITIDGLGSLAASGTMEFNPILTIDGTGGMTASAIRERYFAATIDGSGELTADAIRDRYGSAVIDAVGELIANGSRFRVNFIQLDGPFAPGEKIIIDAKKMTITKNGQNILPLMTGDFFDVNNGTNAIVYTDTASGRSVLLRFTHRDKYLY